MFVDGNNCDEVSFTLYRRLAVGTGSTFVPLVDGMLLECELAFGSDRFRNLFHLCCVC